jgi:hypothetical protein
MSSFRILRRPQPPTKKKVVELAISGLLGKFFLGRSWGAFTLPLPFLVIIFHWVKPGEDPHWYVRLHEFVHVAQDEANWCFLQSWLNYARAALKGVNFRTLLKSPSKTMMDSYRSNKYEMEAYAIEGEALSTGNIPDWVRE